MEDLELYRQVLSSYTELCSQGRPPSVLHAYCKDHGLDVRRMRGLMQYSCPDMEIISGRNLMGENYSKIYEDFKRLCSEGKQPGSFGSYCREHGVSYSRMHWYLKKHDLQVMGLPGYTRPRPGEYASGRKYEEVPFEEVIFEESGFLPAEAGKAITVSVDGHVAVSFPSDTDVAVIVRFVSMMEKEVDHVGT